MIRHLRLKPDFGRTLDRFEAWWHCQVLDRPVTSVNVKPSRPYKGPVAEHDSPRAAWLDVSYRMERAIAELQRHDFLGDSFPKIFPNVGPELTATLLGCQIKYITDATGWSEPIVRSLDDWQLILNTTPDFGSPYWQTIERMTQYAIDQCDEQYIVGMTDLHANYDILAALRDPQALCEDLMDAPELIRQVAAHAARVFIAAFERNYQMVASAGFPSTTWCPILHAGPAYLPNSDFWCMLSPAMARHYVLPEIVAELAPLERSLFHLDGPQALPHLDMLLELPQLNGVQWVFGDGNGPATKWLHVYRRIQQAGKCMEICCGTPAEAMTILEHLRPEGVWLAVGKAFDSAGEATAFLRDVERAAARHNPHHFVS